MGKRGHCQNQEKRVVVPELTSQAENRDLQRLTEEGEVAAVTRHLGGQYCGTGGNSSEIDKGVQQINAGWCEMGRFWTSDAPYAAKSSAFIGSVQGAALSGLTSYVLSSNEKRRLDTKLVGLLRCMMGGAAFDEETNRAMTNCQVYSHWRLLPIDLELAVREVKWFQKLCWGGSAHEQLIGALFAKIRVGGLPIYDALDVGGKLAQGASPFAHKFIETSSTFVHWRRRGSS